MLYPTLEQFTALVLNADWLFEKIARNELGSGVSSVFVTSKTYDGATELWELDADVSWSDGSESASTVQITMTALYETYMSTRSVRPDWDDIWMTFADSIAQRSIDPRRKVGAVIVSENNSQVLALGYNGDYKGGPNAVLSSKPGESGCIHAEINALLKLDYNYPGKKRMYVTTMPCYLCASACINAGIDEVIYRDGYRDETGINILKAAGVIVRPFKE